MSPDEIQNTKVFNNKKHLRSSKVSFEQTSFYFLFWLPMAARVSSSTACDYEALAMNPPVLSYSNASTPVALLIASRIGAVSLKLLPWTEQPSAATPTLVFDEGTKLIGVQSILRYVARHSSESSNLYGTDALDSTMVRSPFLSPIPIRN